MFLDDTACNLASLNLIKFRTDDNQFDVKAFEHAARLWTIVPAPKAARRRAQLRRC